MKEKNKYQRTISKKNEEHRNVVEEVSWQWSNDNSIPLTHEIQPFVQISSGNQILQSCHILYCYVHVQIS